MYRLLVLLNLGVAACLGGAYAVTVSVDSDRVLVVDGTRTFVIGLYENPADDAVLDQVAAAGFNLVNAPANKAALDRLHSRGLYAWVNTGSATDLSADRIAREKQLRELAADLAGHPALLVWEVQDEALWNCWYSAFSWRRGEERTQQVARIASLQDEAMKGKLNAMRNEADVRCARGEFAEWENLIDAIWRELGESPPGPEQHAGGAAERADTMARGLQEGYRFLRGIDPNHPIWMNHAPRNSIARLAEFSKAADVIGCDIYPIPAYRIGHSDLTERSAAAVGAYTTRMQNAAPDKPVWMVLQGFGWEGIQPDLDDETKRVMRQPTPQESRFMAFDAIVRGARGVLYWGTTSVKKDSPFWNELLGLVREISSLQPVLSAHDARLRLRVVLDGSWGSLDDGEVLPVLAKDVDGELWLLVVNEREEPLAYTIEGLKRFEGLELADPAADRRATVTNGRLSLSIEPFGVEILAPVDAKLRR